jgi:hypothetical protein
MAVCTAVQSLSKWVGSQWIVTVVLFIFQIDFEACSAILQNTQYVLSCCWIFRKFRFELKGLKSTDLQESILTFIVVFTVKGILFLPYKIYKCFVRISDFFIACYMSPLHTPLLVYNEFRIDLSIGDDWRLSPPPPLSQVNTEYWPTNPSL